jgi:hypothetical protein
MSVEKIELSPIGRVIAWPTSLKDQRQVSIEWLGDDMPKSGVLLYPADPCLATNFTDCDIENLAQMTGLTTFDAGFKAAVQIVRMLLDGHPKNDAISTLVETQNNPTLGGN